MTKSEKGISTVDIIISVIIITIFITLIGNLIINININAKETERKTQAVTYAVEEIEVIKSEGYKEQYEDRGIDIIEILKEEDIKDKDNNFTGYHKKVIIKDYYLIQKENNNDTSKEPNIVKEVTVQILYKLKNKDETVELSTYIKKE